MAPKTDAEKIADRLAEVKPPEPTDLLNRLVQLKKEIETSGEATLYLQRGSRGEVVGFTVLKGDQIEPIYRNKTTLVGYAHHIDGREVAQYSAAEILKIEAPEQIVPGPSAKS